MTSSFLISTALFLALLFAFPVWDLLEIRRLRATSNIQAREAYYWRIMGVEWSFTFLVILLLGWRATFFFHLLARPPWLPPQDALLGILAAFIVGLAIPILVVMRRPPGENSYFAKQLAGIDYLFPKTQHQRFLFLLVSLTAGICEEIIFRAFAIHYLTALLPAVSIWICVVLASILFGLIHAGQGVTGIVGTGVLGAVFSLLYLGFGVLWIPILLHILLDARFALLPLPRKDTVLQS